MTDVHILKGPYGMWLHRPHEIPDPMLCGVTAFYGYGEQWTTATCLVPGIPSKWRENVEPTCDACCLLYLADPNAALVAL